MLENKKMTNDLPYWQKELIDIRLQSINEDPKGLLPIDSLLEELEPHRPIR